MRKTVHSKLICSYIFIGIVGFLFATAGGSHFVETYLEEEVGARLYDSAVRFASDAVTIQQVADNDSKGLEKIMDILASGEEAGILILDKNFHVIVQSSNLEYNVSSAKSTADSEVQTSETDKIPENGTSLKNSLLQTQFPSPILIWTSGLIPNIRSVIFMAIFPVPILM